MNFSKLALPVIALGAAAVLLTPSSSDAYSFIGGNLSQTQRDFRTYNNFTDGAANNNQVAASQFPGAQGAVMAIWKASVEWGSELHGNGNGDPHQTGALGSGGANFDASFQGEATAVGGTNDNIHSELSGSGGGVLAYTETPISNGWRIRYYSGWTWNDGPSTSLGGGHIDLQGVACHEYGHALGLGHTGTGGATMYPSISGNGVSSRSIATDDKNGIQALYGVKSGTKPHISSYSIVGNLITVTGTGFNGSGNQIWFTQANAGGNGQPVKVTNLTSNGTSITATIPANAGPGDILVRRNSTGHSGLSNAFPSDLAGSVGTSTPEFTSASPSSLPAVVVDGPGTVIFTGQNFTGITEVKVDGVALSAGFPPEFTVLNDNTLSVVWPLVSKLGAIEVEATNASGLGSTTFQVVVNDPPVLEMWTSAPAFLIQANGLRLTAGSTPGDIFYIVASASDLPTPIPGIVSMDIGNNYTSIVIIAFPVIPASGYFDLTVPIGGLPTGFNIFTQGAVVRIEQLYALPATTTNVQTGVVLF